MPEFWVWLVHHTPSCLCLNASWVCPNFDTRSDSRAFSLSFCLKRCHTAASPVCRLDMSSRTLSRSSSVWGEHLECRGNLAMHLEFMSPLATHAGFLSRPIFFCLISPLNWPETRASTLYFHALLAQLIDLDNSDCRMSTSLKRPGMQLSWCRRSGDLDDWSRAILRNG